MLDIDWVGGIVPMTHIKNAKWKNSMCKQVHLVAMQLKDYMVIRFIVALYVCYSQMHLFESQCSTN